VVAVASCSVISGDQSGDLIIVFRQRQRVDTTGNGRAWTYTVSRGLEQLARLFSVASTDGIDRTARPQTL